MGLLERIRRLLSPSERTRGIQVACAVFLCALLDFAGLATLLPVLLFLLEDGKDKCTALLFCTFAIVFIFVKNGAVMRLSRFQYRFLLRLYQRISYSLFRAYYHRGLLFIHSRGSVRLGYEVNFACYAFALNLLAPLLRVAGELLLVGLVTIALLLYAPFTVLLLYLTFLPFMFIYAFGTRKKLRRCGEQEQNARREQSRLVSESLRGYAELELNEAYPSIENAFRKGLGKIGGSRIQMEDMRHIPLYLSEMAVIIGLTLLTAWGMGDLKAMVGVFAVAAFRLLPALRGILGGWTQIQNGICYLRILEEGLLDPFGDEVEETSGVLKGTDKLPFRDRIRLEHVSYAYPGGNAVFKDFSCEIRKGEYVGIRGESGIGKSTLFNLLLGFLPLDKGRIWIDDTPLSGEVKRAWHRRIGYVRQDVFIAHGTLVDNIALGCKCADRRKVIEVLSLVDLDEWYRSLPHGLDTPLGEDGGRLSGGQKQRVGIARALYKEADVLLLDEATSALDNETERNINRMLCRLMREREGLTILSIAHRESSLAYCHRIVTLNGI